MKEYLQQLPNEIKGIIDSARSVAEASKMRSFLVGGFVRDLILNVKNLDVDIVVEGDGISFAEKLAAKLKASLTCHKRFGTATVIVSHALKIDIATAREEKYPHPASLPEVKSGTVKDDLKRRDFSINAMAVSLNRNNYGELIDFFNGRQDLRQKKIRVLHDLSFIDDPTRMLRAIRFEKRFNFRIDPATLKLFKEAVHIRMLEKVQPQRLRDELILLLKEANPVAQIKRMNALLGLSFIHPRLELGKKNSSLLESAQKEICWFKNTFPERRHLDIWLIYLMALLEPLSVKELQAIFRSFVFRKGEEKRMLSFKATPERFIRELSKSNLKPSRIFRLLDPLSYEVMLLLKAKYRNKNLQKHIKDFLEIYNFIRISVTGHDLYKLGFEPGPYYQKVFSHVLKSKLDGKVTTREEEFALIRKLTRL